MTTIATFGALAGLVILIICAWRAMNRWQDANSLMGDFSDRVLPQGGVPDRHWDVLAKIAGVCPHDEKAMRELRRLRASRFEGNSLSLDGAADAFPPLRR